MRRASSRGRSRAVGSREFVRDYRELIQAYKKLPSRPRIILWQPLAPLFVGHRFHGDARVDAINRAIAKVAKLEQVETVDMSTPLLNKTLALNPNAPAGNSMIPWDYARALGCHALGPCSPRALRRVCADCCRRLLRI